MTGLRIPSRITVQLTRKSGLALRRSAERNEVSQREMVNRAIIRNDFFETAEAAGGKIYIETTAGEEERVHLL